MSFLPEPRRLPKRWSVGTAAFASALLAGTILAPASGASAMAAVHASATAPVHLVMYEDDAPFSAAFAKVDNAFCKINNCTISMRNYQGSAIMPALEAAIAAHTQINMELADGQNVAFLAQNHQIMPITGVVPSSRFVKNMLVPFTFGKDVYGYPIMGLYTSGVVYNETLLHKYNLPQPTTFKLAIADGKVLRQHGDFVFDIPAGYPFDLPQWLFQTLEQAAGGSAQVSRLTDKTTFTGKPPFTAPVYVKALTALQTLAKAPGVFEPGFTGESDTAAVALFDSGKAAAYYTGNWDADPAAKAATFKLAVGQFPNYIAGAPAGQAAGPAVVANIFTSAPKADLAIEKKWVRYITSPSVDRELCGLSGDPIPVDAGVKAPRNLVNPKTAYGKYAIATQRKWTTNVFTFLDWTWPAKVTTAMQTDIQAVLGGAMSPEQALRKVQSVFVPAKA